MKYKFILLKTALLCATAGYCQEGKHIDCRGTLFIIGGGGRSVPLMKTLIGTAHLTKKDYIVILPMSSEYPDTSFYYIQQDLAQVCGNVIADLNFTKGLVNNTTWLDSLRNAKLVFITGGDQNRFMNIVLHTPVYKAIWKAFNNGATIAGTSAGAAVMSKQMITGNEFSGDSIVEGSFRSVRLNLVEVKEGLGLLNTAIVDQHFIARSRYNRLLSVLAAFPAYPCIGIDEATAIIVKCRKVTVTGESQVVKLTLPLQYHVLKTNAPLRLNNIRMDILTAGDSFMIR